MTFRPFVASDLLGMETYENLPRDESEKTARFYESCRPSMTALVEDKPVACGGFRILWRGVAEGWGILGKATPHAAIAEFKKKLYEGMNAFELRRVQCYVLCE